jgi:hypothetical protein
MGEKKMTLLWDIIAAALLVALMVGGPLLLLNLEAHPMSQQGGQNSAELAPDERARRAGL